MCQPEQMVEPHNPSKTIAVLNVDPIDWHVIAQAFENHPDHIVPIMADDLKNIKDVGAILSRKALPSQDVPTIILDQNPIRIGAIMDQIESVMLRSNIDSTVEYKGYHLNLYNNVLTVNGENVTLTDRENHIMQALISAGADGCGRDYLLQTVWGYRNDLETHTLETHIYRLRQKIETDPANPLRLVTIPNGYRLV